MNARLALSAFLLFLAGFCACYVSRPHPARGRPRGAPGPDIVVNFPNPNPADASVPRLTRTLKICRVTDGTGDHDTADPGAARADWVLVMGDTTYRAVEQGP